MMTACRNYDPWCCETDEDGHQVRPADCRVCGHHASEHASTVAIHGCDDGTIRRVYLTGNEVAALSNARDAVADSDLFAWEGLEEKEFALSALDKLAGE